MGIPDLTVDGANNNVVRPIGGAVIADFQLFSSDGFWSLGDQCVLTYSGPPITPLVWAQASPWVDTAGGGVSGTWGVALSHNGDLIGGPVLNGGADLDDPLRVAGATAQSFGANNDYASIGTQRRIALATGDTLQPVIGKAQDIVGNQGFLEALTLFALY